MTFNTLSKSDQNELTNDLGNAFGGYAIEHGQRKPNLFDRGPHEDAAVYAEEFYNGGWAKKVGRSWVLDVKGYFESRTR